MSHPFDTATNMSGAAPSGDAFFVLRDARTLFQRQLTDIARQAGANTPQILEAFTEALGTAHDELASSKQADGFETANGLTASRMTLMCDADLELDIRIGDIAKHVVDIGGNTLWRVQLRYMTLLNRPDMTPEGNPVGPEVLARGLLALCQAGNLDLERNLHLLDRIEEEFSKDLPAVYSALNDLLASHNIEPAQSKGSSAASIRASASTGAGTSGAANTGGEGRSDAFSALQQALNAQFGGTPGTLGNNAGTSASAGQGNAPGNMALNAATLVMLNQLTARLEQLQLSTGNTALAGGESGEMPTQPPHALKAADLDLPLGNPEAVALETLGHIFEAIFNTWDLPDTVKTAISRLQIPLLKLSVFDPSLFSDIGHPARRLINAMGRAAAGLPRNIDRSHPISAHLWNIAGAVSETLQGDAAVLAAPIAELDALIAARDSEIREAAQVFVPFLAASEAQERAEQLARRWLDDVAQQPSAQEIHDFIRQYWVKVMAAAALDGGEEGKVWQECKAAITDLMWSVEPKPGADERKRLSLLVATLLKRINGGLDRINATQEQRAPFLDACFNLQFATMRGTAPPLVVPKPLEAPALETPATTDAVIVSETIDGKTLKTLARPGSAATSYRTSAGGVQVGQWLQFSMEGNVPLCGLVAWIAPRSGKVLVANPDWPYAVALAVDVIEKQLQSGQAALVSSRALFDIAAEQALSQIAKGTAASGSTKLQ
ncbi:MAG: DUF1631 family protein [Betaproteobacteria bacterium]|uniref:DUF1631 family protein n=1 Tax=Candidatus Proximibacter danicus TaxID=2954365 RepID=A0A9D7JZR0_9PROT|nr:DUF1631 family protein [Candidatus Proximibacter danicus]